MKGDTLDLRNQESLRAWSLRWANHFWMPSPVVYPYGLQRARARGFIAGLSEAQRLKIALIGSPAHRENWRDY